MEIEKKEVTDFLVSLEMAFPEKARIVREIMNIFVSKKTDLTLGIKYGGIVVFKDGSLIGGIFLSKKHISIEFSNGADFEDTHNVLEGSGKYRRHIKISNFENLKSKNVTTYIEQAIRR